MIKITDDIWMDEYKPIYNNNDINEGLKDFHPNVIKDNEADSEMLYQACRENRVWTLIDADGHLYIVSGFHYVNRLDVYITEIAYNPNEDIEIDWES